jgi:hypothetical protein
MSFSLGWVVPKIRIKGNLFLVAYFYLFSINVKDIVLVPQGDPKYSCVDL